MTRIVHDNFPVERLPDDLRRALGNSTHVRLTIDDLEDDKILLAELDATLQRASEDVHNGRTCSADEVLNHLKIPRQTAVKRANAVLPVFV
jgi:hypothetical protein